MAREQKFKHYVPLRLDEKTHAGLKRAAKKTGVGVSVMARIIIERSGAVREEP